MLYGRVRGEKGEQRLRVREREAVDAWVRRVKEGGGSIGGRGRLTYGRLWKFFSDYRKGGEVGEPGWGKQLRVLSGLNAEPQMIKEWLQFGV